jgi:alpha-1,2-mannosyltransferase
MSSSPPTTALDARERRRVTVPWLFFGVLGVYVLTMARGYWHIDVFGGDWTSWHLARTGSPWIDGQPIPEVRNRSDYLLAIVHTANGHTAFSRFPGIVVAGLPAYLVLGSDTWSIVPGSLTAAVLSAVAVTLMFSALRRYLTDRKALFAAVVFGFATPMWTISANLLWPHTITVLGIAGMAWAASANRWWSAGVFGGVALWGRLHTAVIVAFLGLAVGWRRRDPTLVVRMGIASGAFLLGSCCWNRWMYGTWSPLGGYGQSDLAATESYRYSFTNQLGMWISPDRGILVWTPIILLLLPALARSWRELPDWSRSLLIGGLIYTVVQAAMMTFTGGDAFYGYRYGLEAMACGTPALALSQARMGRVARVLAGPVLAIQFFAFLVGAAVDRLWMPKSQAWHRNAFVHGLDLVGPAGWMLAGVVAAAGLVVALRRVGRPDAPGVGPTTETLHEHVPG